MALFPSLSGYTVYVMRHGRTVLDDEKRSDGWLDYPLSDEGRIGLIKAQQYLKGADIKKVFAPDLRRAMETAHILASGILSRPKVLEANEAKTWNLGLLMGTKKKPNRSIVHYYMNNPNETPAGGESLKKFHDRFIPWLYNTVDRSLDEGSYLIITSGSNLREISLTLTGNTDTFDLDEGGLLALTGSGKSLKGHVVFGHKTQQEEWLS